MIKRLLAVTSLALSIDSFAQDSTSSKQLDEVVVTANKLPQKQTTTGKVITVISKEQIDKSGGRTVGQLLNEQAGITINGSLNNTGTNQSVYMRGASSGRTLVLLDGIPVYDPSLSGNEFDLNLLSLNDIERIEICRGSHSTLYGSDAVAGVINIITVKQNVTKPINAKATISAGNYGTYRGNVQVFGKADKLTYSARYAKLKSDGFSTAYDSSHKQSFDKDGFNGDVAGASLQYQATPELLVRSFIQYSRNKTDVDYGAFKDEKDYAIKNKSVMAGAGFNYRRNGVSITGNYQYSDVSRNYTNDSTDDFYTKFYSNDNFGKAQYIEAYANINLGKGFSWLQGADYRFSSMSSQSLSISSFGPYADKINDTSHSQASMFTSLFYNAPNEKLNIELGGRMNVHSRYGSNYTYTFNPSYNFNHNFRVFGSIATAFKAPSLYQLFSLYGDPNLQPERSSTYELGVQVRDGRQLSTRLVYFHRRIKSGIDFDYVNYKYFNAAQQTVTGLEFEATAKPVNEVTVTVNYTYLDPKDQIQSRETFKDTTYHYLLRRPKHNVNVTAGYQITSALYVSASGKYVSSRYDVGGYMAPDIKLGDYFILNAYAEYKFPKYIKLFVDAQNVTDRKFFDVSGYNSIPFVFNGGIILNW